MRAVVGEQCSARRRAQRSTRGSTARRSNTPARPPHPGPNRRGRRGTARLRGPRRVAALSAPPPPPSGTAPPGARAYAIQSAGGRPQAAEPENQRA